MKFQKTIQENNRLGEKISELNNHYNNYSLHYKLTVHEERRQA